MGKTLSDVQKLGDRMHRAAVEATKTAQALASIGKIPDARPGFNAEAPSGRISREQQFSIDARRLGL